ncbi:hypothetical protein BFP72_08780 [Reichenbachiella sp. 5M10]|uniref:PAS domain-containing protein n=1 Tax=Reichenbachiella sp. 5M10 TaxID=1889772 RepID=UPI000C14A17A|nr:PAS domain-containing protein [Reichenbachiella sp. 5M10]PIB35479.1 hypothetical protein BFP72_08780 [Reichenbachiella sp. 5M10]
MPVTQNSNDQALVGVCNAITELIVNPNFEEALDVSLKHIGEVFDVDVFVSELLHTKEGMVMTVKHHWMKVYDQKRIDLNTSNHVGQFVSQHTSVHKGIMFSFKKSTAPPEVIEHLEQTGGKSGLLVPIFVEDQWWGVLSLATVEYERDWSESIISVLQSLASAIGATLSKIIYRRSLEHEVVQQATQIIERNHQYESLVRNIPGIVFRCLMDQQWTMKYISPYVKELTGYEPDEFTDVRTELTFAQLIHPNDQDYVWTEVSRQLKRGEYYRVNYRIRDKKGNERWLWEQGVIQQSRHGERLLEGCIIDITDRVKSHEKVVAATLETEDRERSHFSREIHDNLQQVLTTAHLNLEHAKKLVSQDDAMRYLISASGSLKEAIVETRSLSHRLMPKTIEDYGYHAAVESMLEGLADLVETKFEFLNNIPDKRLPINVALSLFRITQEAVTNIIKYAHAHSATIQLMRHEGSLILTIDDDGVGFDTEDVLDAEHGFGINNMKNRATSIGGQLHIDSAKERGTHILIEVPYLTNKEDVSG